MKALKYNTVIKKSGEIRLTGLPFSKGENIEMIVILESKTNKTKKEFTANELLKTNIIGIWKNRKDIIDSLDYAKHLRNISQNRNYHHDNA